MLIRYRNHGLEKMYNNVFTMGINGINWNHLVIERQAMKGISEHGNITCQQNLYQHNEII
jgi:hypothetical protein